jgi:toxin YoeB
VRLLFSRHAWEDYLTWQSTDQAGLERLNDLIRDTTRSPFQGIGKPEPLVGPLKGWWSRRATLGHRLVYRATGEGDAKTLEIAACRTHYGR